MWCPRRIDLCRGGAHAYDCERFVQVMAKKPLSVSTKQGALITLSALLTFAVQKKRLRTDNPAAGLSKELRDPNAPAHHTLNGDDFFTADEAAHLLMMCRVSITRNGIRSCSPGSQRDCGLVSYSG